MQTDKSGRFEQNPPAHLCRDCSSRALDTFGHCEHAADCANAMQAAGPEEPEPARQDATQAPIDFMTALGILAAALQQDAPLLTAEDVPFCLTAEIVTPRRRIKAAGLFD